jgi:hypothetical protein
MRGGMFLFQQNLIGAVDQLQKETITDIFSLKTGLEAIRQNLSTSSEGGGRGWVLWRTKDHRWAPYSSKR